MNLELVFKLSIEDTLDRWNSLTLRQVQVSMLQARGWTDKQIAAYLRSSVKNVEHHAQYARRKLRVLNRVGLANAVNMLLLSGRISLHLPGNPSGFAFPASPVSDGR